MKVADTPQFKFLKRISALRFVNETLGAGPAYVCNICDETIITNWQTDGLKETTWQLKDDYLPFETSLRMEYYNPQE